MSTILSTKAYIVKLPTKGEGVKRPKNGPNVNKVCECSLFLLFKYFTTVVAEIWRLYFVDKIGEAYFVKFDE